ncbi:MAG: hypothetical protein L6R48_10770 [Planctomycetes bacterium]|nr:hypothetical protein [Planctomycetota bacterium]
MQWSDGKVEEGTVELGQDVVFHDGTVQHRLPKARIREIRLATKREELAASWRFPEPGKPFKELVGRPFPVRDLVATLRLDDGSKLNGHLHTTVAYLELADGSRSKVLIPAKQQGTSEQTLADLVYPVRVVVAGEGAAAVPTRLLLPVAAVGRADGAAVLAGAGLVRYPATMTGEGLTLPPGIELPAVVAVQGANGLSVAWPAPGADDAALRARVSGPLAELADYMDEHRLLGIWQPPGDVCLLTLLMLRRVGATTGEQDAKPWRLEVWRWRPDPVKDTRFLIAARGFLLRGTGVAPPVAVEHAWWPLRATAAGYEVGGEEGESQKSEGGRRKEGGKKP